MFALRAKATIAFPPSQTNRLAGVTTPSSAAAIEARSTFGNTASMVAPSRSRATRIGNVFEEEARVLRLAAPLARLAGKTGAAALEQFQDERLVRLDNSGQRLGLVQGGRAEKPVSPAERRGRVDAAALCGLGEAGSLEHRLGVVEPLLLLAQPRHRRLRQGVEGAPAALAAIARQTVRPSPGDDVPARAMGTTPAFDLAWPISPSASSRTRRSKRALPPAAFARDAPGSRAPICADPPEPDPTPSATPAASVNASNACRRCAGLSFPIPLSQRMNSPCSTAASLNQRRTG